MSIAEYRSPRMALGEGYRESSGSARSLYKARDGVVEGSGAGVKAVLGDVEEKAASRSRSRGFLPPSAMERLGEENPHGSGVPAIRDVVDSFSAVGEPAGAEEDENPGNEAEKGIRRGSVSFGRSFRRLI
ncbi:MAG: hypothetical protein IKF96_04920, partial [Eggerthellaceae bacterium]|nr:hypothetical protein [Eggerthellaceae bacterium]